MIRRPRVRRASVSKARVEKGNAFGSCRRVIQVSCIQFCASVSMQSSRRQLHRENMSSLVASGLRQWAACTRDTMTMNQNTQHNENQEQRRQDAPQQGQDETTRQAQAEQNRQDQQGRGRDRSEDR